MTQTNPLKQAIERFYADVAPSRELSDRLRALAEVDLAPARPADARPAQTRALLRQSWRGYALATAACLGMALTYALGYRVGAADRSSNGRGLRPIQIPTSSPTLEGPTVEANNKQSPSLVAVRLHADWCPRCPTIAPIYADLEKRFGDDPVLFVTLDLTTPTTRQQARLLAQSLGVPNALEEPRGPGQIKLIDRGRHEMLAVIEGEGDLKNWEAALAKALPKEPL